MEKSVGQIYCIIVIIYCITLGKYSVVQKCALIVQVPEFELLIPPQQDFLLKI